MRNIKIILALSLLLLANLAFAQKIHLDLHNLKSSALEVLELNPVIFPGRVHTNSSVIVNVSEHSVNAGRVEVKEEVPAGTEVLGNYQVIFAQGTYGEIYRVGGSGTAYIYAATYNKSGGNFSFAAGPAGERTIDDLQTGMTLNVLSNSLSGTYTGEVEIQVSITSPASMASTVTIPMKVNFVFLPANSILTQRDMVFPPVLVGSGDQIYNLSPSNVGAAVFSATGAANGSATVHVENSTVELTKSGTSRTVTVYGFQYGGNALSTGHVSFDSTGLVNNIRVGATAYFPGGTPGGVYTGTNTLEITNN